MVTILQITWQKENLYYLHTGLYGCCNLIQNVTKAGFRLRPRILYFYGLHFIDFNKVFGGMHAY